MMGSDSLSHPIKVSLFVIWKLGWQFSKRRNLILFGWLGNFPFFLKKSLWTILPWMVVLAGQKQKWLPQDIILLSLNSLQAISIVVHRLVLLSLWLTVLMLIRSLSQRYYLFLMLFSSIIHRGMAICLVSEDWGADRFLNKTLNTLAYGYWTFFILFYFFYCCSKDLLFSESLSKGGKVALFNSLILAHLELRS